MEIRDRLLTLATIWAEASNRSTATLATIVAKDGKMIDRLAAGRDCNSATADRFFRFFRDAANWPSGEVPGKVSALLDGVYLGVGAHADPDTIAAAQQSPGKSGEVTGAAA